MIEVRCKCKKKLGRFDSEDDHSGVLMECPKCKKTVRISNGFICEVEENPGDYDNPKFIEADYA